MRDRGALQQQGQAESADEQGRDEQQHRREQAALSSGPVVVPASGARASPVLAVAPAAGPAAGRVLAEANGAAEPHAAVHAWRHVRKLRQARRLKQPMVTIIDASLLVPVADGCIYLWVTHRRCIVVEGTKYIYGSSQFERLLSDRYHPGARR
ncbi:hypothetical protein QAD02_014388 [Eretmocerus hayati]|uniref:Uncharacterized protein n=1 Tax=Eretmocerus hayati TaxID=131215 RepID=A0ACC2P6E6_9HYME|nr:hypothetical protein QAD02_014388 [Eretmocerus hayati]